MSEVERLQSIIDQYYNGSRKEFSFAMGLDTAQLSRALSGKHPLPMRCNALLAKKGISWQWLRTGAGSINIDTSVNQMIVMDRESTYNSGDNQNKDMVDLLKEQVEILRKNNDHLIEQNNKLVNAIIERAK